MATHRDMWPECTVAKDQFWKGVDENRTEAQPSCEQTSDSFGENISFKYETPFMDQKESESIFISLRSILRMKIKRTELPWTKCHG